MSKKALHKYQDAKLMVLVPAYISLGIVIFYLLAVLLEKTSDGTSNISSIIAGVAFFCAVITPAANIILSSMGTVFAYQSQKLGNKKARILLVFGAIEIICYIVAFIVSLDYMSRTAII